MNCTLCQAALETQTEEDRFTCHKCMQTLGVVEMPPLSRPARPCARCNSLKFVRAIPREYSSTGGANGNQIAAPMFVSHPPMTNNPLFCGPLADPLHLHTGYGMLEMFICRGCGFVEWWCPRVSEIPADPLFNTEMVDYGASKGGPFR